MIVKSINSFQELDTLKVFWEASQNCPNNDFEHYQLVCRLRQEVERPYIAIVECDGDIDAMLVARIENISFAPSIGYFKPVRIPTKSLTVLYQGLLGNDDDNNCRLLVRHIWSFLESGQADMVHFHNLSEHSILLKSIMACCPQRHCEKATQWNAHWSMTLPEQPGFLLKKLRAKHRSWITGRQKKLESAYPGKLSWQWISKFDDITGLAVRLETLAARTYQRGLGAGFVNDEEHRQRYRLFADRGQLRVQLVEIEGELKAFWIGTVYKNVFFSAETGYDSNLRAYELGTLMFIAMADELVREGVSKIDFGLGDAFYKERFGDENWRETNVQVFAPNFKGLLLRSISGCFTMIDNTLRRLLQKTGVLNWVKTGLRRLMQRK
ncbi:MAG: GNAT family N-acetyltransferase [Smithella sp.]